MVEKLKKLREMTEEKKDFVTSEEDNKKLQFISDFLKNDNCFFELDMKTSINILCYLGMSKEEAMKNYFELISPVNFQKTPKVREIVEIKEK